MAGMLQMGDRLRVNEIYKSIQGESFWAGLPCAFVRLTGCHLRCTYCDTEYAFYDGRWMTLDQVVARVAEFGVALVEITGGEPLLQPGCGVLAQMLLDKGYTVLCETSGALPIDRLPAGVIKIMDLKCPSSGEVGRNDWSNIDRLAPQDEVKFVIGDRADFEWSVGAIERYEITKRCKVAMSPVFDKIEPQQLAEWILAGNLPVRLQLQLHKLIWDPMAVGV